MAKDSDLKQQMLEMIKQLTPEQLAELNDAVRDALLSAANGQPPRYAINEVVHISQEEARRICRKIGLDWDTGRFASDDAGDADPAE